MKELVKLLRQERLGMATELILQDALEVLLRREGVRFEREARLDPRNVIDFLAEGGLGVECKLVAPRLAVFRQVERYCQFPEVKGIILLTRTVMTLPSEINGRPAAVVNLGRAWL